MLKLHHEEPQSFELKSIDFTKKQEREQFRATKLNELLFLEIIRSKQHNPRLCLEYRNNLQLALDSFERKLKSEKNDFERYEMAKLYVQQLQELYAEFKYKLLSPQ